MTDYERYQLAWMMEHGHSLTELIEEMSELSYDIPDAEPGALFDAWEADRGFGGEIYASETEWRAAEGKEAAPTFDRGLIEKGLEQGVITTSVGDSALWVTIDGYEFVAQEQGEFYVDKTDADVSRDDIINSILDTLDLIEREPSDRASVRLAECVAYLLEHVNRDDATSHIVPAQPRDIGQPPFEAVVTDHGGQAVNDFLAPLDHEWMIPGCTPNDVLEWCGVRYDIDQRVAAAIASDVNDSVSQYDDMFTDCIKEYVTKYAEDGRISPAPVAPSAHTDAHPSSGISLMAEASAMREAAEHLDTTTDLSKAQRAR